MNKLDEFMETHRDAVMVFGSNVSGIHGAGAACAAYRQYGAVLGVGVGLEGRSYALPTKGLNISFMPLNQIAIHVEDFKDFASKHPKTKFAITAVGTGLSGFHHYEIAPMFKGVGINCFFDTEWRHHLGSHYNYWGTF